MKISANARTGKKVELISCKSPSNPSVESFSAGNFELRYWDDEKENWEVRWKALKSECDVYGRCGAFGSCDSRSLPICTCLRGFEPNNTKEWSRGNWTSGCVRRTPLQCGRVNSTGGEADKMDGFLKQKMMKVPDFADWSPAHEDDCRQQCLQNCSCIAYAYDTGTGCMSWTRSLIDTLQFSSGGVDLYIRVASSELDKVGEVIKTVTDKGVEVKKIVTITAITGTIFLSVCTYLLWRWMTKEKGDAKVVIDADIKPIDSILRLMVKMEILSTFAYEDKSLSYFALNSQGNLVLKYMSNGLKDVVWLALHTECDVYGKCGAFGTCDPKNTPICSCFQGFEPNNLEEWNQGNWTSGCVRRALLQCERVNTGGEEGKKDGFLKLKMMKVPDDAAWSNYK
ncbi:g-type lectin s-receptor-like serine/threonine-protein kinase [Quercus suber]|uniref:G-type lectin s-receptor-like serine/threonine-protein kinase n=1 Tax=Quercus suber TaxID=58331 RepID=A0AAW0IML1_QUESU